MLVQKQPPPQIGQLDEFSKMRSVGGPRPIMGSATFAGIKYFNVIVTEIGKQVSAVRGSEGGEVGKE